MPIKQLAATKSSKPEKADMQVTINVNDSGVTPSVIPPVADVVLPEVFETPLTVVLPKVVLPVVQPRTLREAVIDSSPPMVDTEEEDAQAIVAFVKMYLNLVDGAPSQMQVDNLAMSLGWSCGDLQSILVMLSGGAVDDAIKNDLRDADLQGNPGMNTPGDLDAFANNNLQPFGKTDLDEIETPGTLKLFASSSKEVEFMQPMSYLDGEQKVPDKNGGPVTADVDPGKEEYIGVDDGAPIDEEIDAIEQDALMNDGEIETLDMKEGMNDTRYLNDDGLT